MEIHGVELRRFQVLAELIKRGSVEIGSTMPVVDVLFDQDVARRSNLLAQLEKLALDGSLLPLDFGADTRVQCRLLHMYESIPQKGQRVESIESVENDSGKSQGQPSGRMEEGPQV